MFRNIRELIKVYAISGTEDRIAVQNFMDCENDDTIRSLRNELTGISAGNFPEENLKNLLGEARRSKHGSYVDWAKRVIVWMAEYRR